MYFSYTAEEFAKLDLKPTATDEEICLANPDYTKPALTHNDGKYYVWQIEKTVAKPALRVVNEYHDAKLQLHNSSVW